MEDGETPRIKIWGK